MKQKGLNYLILCKKVEKISPKVCIACNSVNFEFLMSYSMKFQKILEHKVEKSRTSKVVFDREASLTRS